VTVEDCKESTRRKELVGTVSYMAPELVTSQAYSEKSDVWAVGVILYVLLIGELPFAHRKSRDGQMKSTAERFKEIRNAKLQFDPELWDGITDNAKEVCIPKLPNAVYQVFFSVLIRFSPRHLVQA
jgi:serine/threonine protein kinase